MPGVDLDPIETRHLRARRRSAELRHRQVDVRLFEHLDVGPLHARKAGQLVHQEIVSEIAFWRGRDRGRPQRMIPPRRIARNQPAMVQLHRDLATGRVDAFGKLSQARQEPVVRNRGLLPRHRADRPRHPGYARDDQPGAAAGLRFVVSNQAFANGAIVFGQAHPHRGDDDAVLEVQPADAARRKQVRVSVRDHAVRLWRSRRQQSARDRRSCRQAAGCLPPPHTSCGRRRACRSRLDRPGV